MTHTADTSAAIVPVEPSAAPLALASAVEAARGFAASSRAENTRRAYASDWRAFTAWAEAAGVEAHPARPEAVAAYAAHLAGDGRKASTIGRALSSIATAHKVAGLASPCDAPVVRETMRGIRRTIGTAPAKRAPVDVATLRSLVSHLPAGLVGVRDRAMLACGVLGALRRSELVALDVADLAFTADGLEVTIRRSKTDQEAAGVTIGLPFAGDPAVCPVRALRAWLEAARVESGPVFRAVNRHGQVAGERLSDRAVHAIVCRYAAAAGLDASRFGAHSLRSGLATSAAKAGKPLDVIMRHGRWKSPRVAIGYVQRAALFTDNAAAGLV